MRTARFVSPTRFRTSSWTTSLRPFKVRPTLGRLQVSSPVPREMGISQLVVKDPMHPSFLHMTVVEYPHHVFFTFNVTHETCKNGM